MEHCMEHAFAPAQHPFTNGPQNTASYEKIKKSPSFTIKKVKVW
jgi:hypothetical protein